MSTTILYPREGNRLVPATGANRPGEVTLGIDAARRRLYELQAEDGHWCGELEGDTILESEYVLLLYFLGRGVDGKIRRAAEYLRTRQEPEGGWALYPGGPTDVSSSVKAYLVLKLVGDDPGAPHMARARQQILKAGGLDACNSFTKIYLSIFEQYEWSNSPCVPPELILFPNWFPFFNIYEMSSWSRGIVVPLSIISACKPSCAMPEGFTIEELRLASPQPRQAKPAGGATDRAWNLFFRSIDRAHKLLEKLHLLPFRRMAIRRAEQWTLGRLEMSDGLGAIFPPIVNAIIALRCLEYPEEHPAVSSQIRELEKLEIEENGTLRMEPCKSPIWDTALALNALGEIESADQPRLRAAAEWLLDREVRHPGDWRVKNPEGPIGGWYFEYANEFYPDCDDTAQVLTALSKLKFSDKAFNHCLQEVKDRAWAWLQSMQNRDGGWASFDKDCDRAYLTHIPFADHNAMIDPSTTDITARVLEAMVHLGKDLEAPEAKRAIEFLRSNQEPDGSWYGRWGCNYIYGTWLALWSLTHAGEDPSQDWIQAGAKWLRGCQNTDGGWGELPQSYADPDSKGIGPSTVTQTAWALLGLMAVGDHDSEGVLRGVEYLLAEQESTGGWTDAAWTGTGFPEVFYLNYHLYATYFPLWALSTYRRGSATEGASKVMAASPAVHRASN